MFKKVLEKARETFVTGSILGKLHDYLSQITWNESDTLPEI